jgi:hypothetical protein
VEAAGITTVDKEIDVFRSHKRFFEADIAFPMTIANAFLFQRFDETADGWLARDSRSRVVRLSRYGFSRPF